MIAASVPGSIEPTVREIVVWVDDVALSTGQIQKAYDWSIAQWSTLGNAILTAASFLIATGLVETYKKTLQLPHFWRGWAALRRSISPVMLSAGSGFIGCGVSSWSCIRCCRSWT